MKARGGVMTVLEGGQKQVESGNREKEGNPSSPFQRRGKCNAFQICGMLGLFKITRELKRSNSARCANDTYSKSWPEWRLSLAQLSFCAHEIRPNTFRFVNTAFLRLPFTLSGCMLARALAGRVHTKKPDSPP